MFYVDSHSNCCKRTNVRISNYSLLVVIAVFAQLGIANTASSESVFEAPTKISKAGYHPGYFGFEVSPDSRRVVYVANKRTTGNFLSHITELFSTPIEGGATVTLGRDSQSGGELDDFTIKIDPTSRRVLYIQGSALMSVPISGGAATKLNINGALPRRHDVYIISPDGQRVVYSLDTGLFSVPIGGGTPIELSSGGSQPEITPNSQRVIFTSGNQIHSAPIAGGATPVVLVNSAELEYFSPFVIDRTSTRVVYRSGRKIFSVEINGGIPIQLGPTVGENQTIIKPTISPDGQQVVYEISDITSPFGFSELFSVPIDGGTPKQLNPSGSVIWFSNFEITPDGQHVVFAIRSDPYGANLYSAPILGGEAKLLFEDIYWDVEEPWVTNYQIATNSQRVVALLRSRSVRSAPIDGSGDETRQLVNRGYSFRISPDGLRVIFRQVQGAPGTSTELFSIPIAGGRPADRINRQLPSTEARVGNYRISSNSQYVVYLADQDVVSRDELYSSKLRESELCVPVPTKSGSMAMVCL